MVYGAERVGDGSGCVERILPFVGGTGVAVESVCIPGTNPAHCGQTKNGDGAGPTGIVFLGAGMPWIGQVHTCPGGNAPGAGGAGDGAIFLEGSASTSSVSTTAGASLRRPGGRGLSGAGGNPFASGSALAPREESSACSRSNTISVMACAGDATTAKQRAAAKRNKNRRQGTIPSNLFYPSLAAIFFCN